MTQKYCTYNRQDALARVSRSVDHRVGSPCVVSMVQWIASFMCSKIRLNQRVWIMEVLQAVNVG